MFNGKDSASVLNACIDWQIGDILQWSQIICMLYKNLNRF